MHKTSVTRFGEILKVFGNFLAISREFIRIWLFLEGSVSICRNFEHALANVNDFGQNFVAVNGKILSTLSVHTYYNLSKVDLSLQRNHSTN